MPQLSHTLTTTYKDGAGTVTVKSEVVQGDMEIAVDVVVPSGVSDFEVDLGSIPVAHIKAFAFACIKATGDPGTFNGMHVSTNIPGTGVTGNDFDITATNGVSWSTSDPTALQLIVTPITKVYVDNNVSGTTAAARFIAKFLIDATP